MTKINKYNYLFVITFIGKYFSLLFAWPNVLNNAGWLIHISIVFYLTVGSAYKRVLFGCFSYFAKILVAYIFRNGLFMQHSSHRGMAAMRLSYWNVVIRSRDCSRNFFSRRIVRWIKRVCRGPNTCMTLFAKIDTMWLLFAVIISTDILNW